MQPVFRFAPSPNGHLHLGHAYSALLNQRLAREAGGRLLIRIEDIDTVRCTDELVADALDDLAWLGVESDGPVLRQSTRFAAYSAVAARLWEDGFVYPCTCSRRDIEIAAMKVAGIAPPPRDPDHALIYPGTCRDLPREVIPALGQGTALRLDLARVLKLVPAPLTWVDAEAGKQVANPGAWGDVVLMRKDTPASYHLAVVLDDAFQGVTDVVRGMDLFPATDLHRLLQEVLGLPMPRYHHHRLLTDSDGQKLAKSRMSHPLRALRSEGVTAAEIRASLGFAG